MIILRQKYIEEQREYGLVQDIRSSGVKRTYKKIVGSARKKAAQKLDQQIQDNIRKNQEKVTRANGLSIMHSSDGAKKFLEENKGKYKYSVTTSGLYTAGGAASLDETALKDLPDIRKKYLKGDAKNLIIAPWGTSFEEAAHEVGHIANSQSKGLKRWIHRKGTNARGAEKLISSTQILANGVGDKAFRTREIEEALKDGRISPEAARKLEESISEAGIIRSLKNGVYGAFRRQEEKNASKFALNQVKKAGRDVKSAKEYLDAMGETYDPVIKNSSIIPLRNKIQIPSRRGDFGNHVYHGK